MTTHKQYHTLLSRKPDQLWAIEFGDYSRKVVDEERRVIKSTVANEEHATIFQIITTDEDQASISAAVAKLNEEVK